MKKTIISLALILSCTLVFAQPNPPADPTPLPGIAWLIAVGAAFGAKKVYDKKKA